MAEDTLRGAAGRRASDTSDAPPPDSPKRSVDEWVEAKFPPTPSGRPHADRWKHNVAAGKHRWLAHAHDRNAPMQLTAEDYSAAIEKSVKDEIHKPAFYDGGAK